MTPVAVVTGAFSGTGAATARRLAAERSHMLAAARRTGRLAGLVAEIAADGGHATAVACDVTSDPSVAALDEAAAPGPMPLAGCVAWCATRPHHVNVDRLVVRPLAQAAQHKVHRVGQ